MRVSGILTSNRLISHSHKTQLCRDTNSLPQLATGAPKGNNSLPLAVTVFAIGFRTRKLAKISPVLPIEPLSYHVFAFVAVLALHIDLAGLLIVSSQECTRSTVSRVTTMFGMIPGKVDDYFPYCVLRKKVANESSDCVITRLQPTCTSAWRYPGALSRTCKILGGALFRAEPAPFGTL